MPVQGISRYSKTAVCYVVLSVPGGRCRDVATTAYHGKECEVKTIVASVGHGGLNRTDDVRLVQELLNRHMQPPQRPLIVDGVMSPRTIAAIEAFQRRVLNMRRPEGRIHPGDPTMVALTRQAEQTPTP